jgi:hypothetical protein
LKEGWCRVRNPFTDHEYRVSLARADVLGWVFWSRNYGPFLETLRALHGEGHRFLCHFTINGFPRALEPRTITADAAIDIARQMASDFGPAAVLWRYDPVLLSSITPPEWHLENFARLARGLQGSAQRCYFSFPCMYRKTERNLAAAAARESFRAWSAAAGDFSLDDLAGLARRIAGLAAEHGMGLYSCCGERWSDPSVPIFRARCVDWPLLREMIPGGDSADVPLNPTRKGCGCYKSIDIGRYDTCAHGCVYCYAVSDPARARENLVAHSLDQPML